MVDDDNSSESEEDENDEDYIQGPPSRRTRYGSKMKANDIVKTKRQRESDVIDPVECMVGKVAKVTVDRTDDNPTLGEAMAGPDWNPRWKDAVDKEFATLEEMKTYSTVAKEEIPAGAYVYPTKEVLSTKRDPITGEIVQSKARLVVVGSALNVVYQNVFAPTANDKSLKVMFALAVATNMVIQTVDIRGAFLYAKQVNDVYITLPTKLTNGEKVYKKLHKTLYGLPDSPQAFYDDISIYLLENGYKRCSVDPCFFYKREGKFF